MTRLVKVCLCIGLLATTTKAQVAGSGSVTGSGVITATAPAPSGSLSLTPGWVKIPGTTLFNPGTENITPCPADGFRGYSPQPGGATTGFASRCNDVIGDPSSSAVDWSRNRMLLWGGGHLDYGGNELYSLELLLAGKDIFGNPFVASSTAKGPLTRLTNPGPPNLQATQIETLPAATSLTSANTTDFGPCVGSCITTPGWPDPNVATPNSRHLYDGWIYDPNLDAGISVGGARNSTGGASNATWLLPMNSVNRTCSIFVAPICQPQWVNEGTTYSGPGTGTMMHWDPNTNYLWLYTSNIGNQLCAEADNALTGGWTCPSSGPSGFGFRMVGVIDTDRDYFVHIGNNPPNDTIGYWPLKGYTIGGAGFSHVAPTLDTSCVNMMSTWLALPGGASQTTNYVGSYYDQIGKRITMWPGLSNVIWHMDTGTWTCTSETYGSTKGIDYPQDTDTENAPGVTGTFTRFGYFPNQDTTALCNDPRSDCWYLHVRRGNVAVTNITAGTLTNQPISISQPFRDGDVTTCVNAYIDGVAAATTQTDVKNRYADGNLKFAIVSFIIPSIAAGKTVHITYDTQGGCNNSSPLTKAQMLANSYNFDATIALTGTASPTISARAILNAATTCADPGTDFEGSSSLCTYWLQGPIVTAVLLADRQGRTFDTNTDGLTGNPLHPEFEAWFYPQNNAVQIGISLENIWASKTTTSSARDQTYSAVLKTGCGATCSGSGPTTVLTQTSGTQQTRTRWHRLFWLNQSDPTTLFTIDHNYRYLSTTKFFPNWDPLNPVTPTTLAAGANPVGCTPASYATQSQGLFNVNTTGNSVGCIPVAIAATGANEYHGALPTWDIAYLMTQDPGYRKVSFGDGAGNPGHGDLINEVPYFYREADASAGHTGFFDVGGTVATRGRIISINARQQIALNSTTTVPTCNVVDTNDWIHFGGSGEDLTPWGANNLDTTHEGNAGYVPYLSTGQLFYYETVLMQAAYAIGLGPGNRACTQASNNANLRQANLGYYYNDQERGQTWIARDNALAAFIGIDGSPEKAYFENFLKQNISVWQGARSLVNDYPANSAAYTYGSTSRNVTTIGAGSVLGSWTQGVPAYVTDAGSILNQSGGSKPASGNAEFQNAYSAVVIAWIHDLGYNPSDNLRGFMANFYLNRALNPANTIFDMAAYSYPTQDNAGLQTNISTWAQFNTFYASHNSSWPTCNVGVDEGQQYINQGATSLYYDLTSSQGGYSGATAFNTLVTSMNCKFTTGSPKWDLVPRGPYGLAVFPIPAKNF